MLVRRSRISKKQYKRLLDCFIADVNAVQAAALSGVSRPCANRYYKHFRELIYASLSRAPRFGGEVEIDIGFFAGRSSKKDAAMVRRLAGLPAASIVAKRRSIAKTQKKKIPVLGILRRGGDVYLHPIRSRSRRDLEAVVHLVVENGTRVYTDEEKGLSNLKFSKYRHESINHSVAFASRDLTEGAFVHINGIESVWSQCRLRLARLFKGIPRHTLLLHIKECEYRFNHRQDFPAAFKSLLQ